MKYLYIYLINKIKCTSTNKNTNLKWTMKMSKWLWSTEHIDIYETMLIGKMQDTRNKFASHIMTKGIKCLKSTSKILPHQIIYIDFRAYFVDEEHC